jgi:hypothetical protein
MNGKISSFVQRRIVLAALATILICAALSTLMTRSFLAGLRPQPREGFLTDRNLPPNWKGPKTTLLVREGLHFMFTDGSMKNSPEVLESKCFFLPSMKDTLCFYTNNAPTSMNCNDMRLSLFSESDPYELPADFECSNNIVGAPPLQKDDTHIRILNALYALRKRCMKMCRAMLQNVTVAGLPAGTIQLSLEPKLISTNAFMLCRPNFVCGLNSIMYGVSYDRSHYPTNSHNIINYDSRREASDQVKVILYPVNGSVRGTTYTTSISSRTLMEDAKSVQMAQTEGVSDASPSSLNVPIVQVLPLNLFYCTPLKSLASEVPYTEAMTLFFPNKVAIPGTMLFDKQLTVLCESMAPGANGAAATQKKIRVHRDGNYGELDVPVNSDIIVTYSVNLVTITAMDATTGAIVMSRFTGFTPLAVSDPKDLQASINSNAHGSATLPDPFFNLSVPNMLNFALSQNMPLGIAC